MPARQTAISQSRTQSEVQQDGMDDDGGFLAVLNSIQRESNQLNVMRLAVLALACLVIATAAWLMPWIPIGMTWAAYDGKILLSLGLSAASWLALLLLYAAYGEKFRGEVPGEFLRVLFGAGLLVRSRPQFHSRLGRQCRKAAKSRRHNFALILLRLDVLPEERDAAAALIRDAIRADDVLGEVERDELAILAFDAGSPQEEIILNRLRQALLASSELSNSQIGSSLFTEDGPSPDDLVERARNRLEEVSAATTRVAWL